MDTTNNEKTNWHKCEIKVKYYEEKEKLGKGWFDNKYDVMKR